ncbi:MAG: N-acetylmuramoyl-L-alanine amidase family protein [Lachnospiraceae bacterium]|nr:N-acetylmuramoyl-L-alanine amidase family protein [Lachnospiraceae bacterium]
MKKLHFLALFILLFSISSLTVFAASETEDNGSLESANALSLNTTVTGAISSEDDEDWYKVTLSQDGALTIQFTHEDLKDSYRFWNVYLMDSNGLTVAGDEETCYKFSGEGTGYSLAETGLPAGTYYIRVTASYRHSDSAYSLKADFTASSFYEKEYNDSAARATSIELDTVYKGSTFADYSDEDWYKITLPEDGALTVQFTYEELNQNYFFWNIRLYNSQRQDITGGEEQTYSFSGSDTGYSLPEVGLPAGVYYIRVAAYQSPHTDVNYNLKAGFTASSAYEKEANGTRTSATPIKANAACKGGIFGTSHEEEDYYKIVLAKNDTVRIRFAHPLMTTDYEYWRICLLNSVEEIIQVDGLDSCPIPGNKAEVTLPAVDLPAGTYYIRITSGYSHGSDLNYTLTVDAPNNGTAGWRHNSTGWWYQRADGTYPVSQWEKIKGKWYHFDNRGYMQTGWQKFGSVWYYLGTDGAMRTGWQKINGSWYYMSSSGAMQTGWKQLAGMWYYFESSGAMVTGWKTLAGTTYYFKASGAMAAKEWCSGWWLNADGSWTYKYKASWTKNAKGWWFGDTSGWYAKNVTLTIDDKKYTFDANGYWVK